MIEGILRRAKFGCESVIDDRNFGTRADLGCREFPAVQNPSAMVWKYSDKTGTSVEPRLAGRPSNPNGPPTNAEAYSGRNSVALAARTPGSLRIRSRTSSK
jgi:hypothetical protein